MNYRRLGRTNLQVSVIGFGTCQLRLVPERIAIETLRRGFELGVNIVHTAPDYEGADDLVAQVVKERAPNVIVCSQGYGSIDLFEYFFESACAKFGKRRLELFGIACVEDREALGENVWGAGGMIEFLLQKKREGRLGGIFCTTHGSPEYISSLIKSNVFDALMVAYNMLGFHLLSFNPLGNHQDDLCLLEHESMQSGALKLPQQRTTFESIPRTREEVFPLARQYDIGLMIMKPLAGGLLCPGKAFPPRAYLTPARAQISAREALRFILTNPEVSCVVPGTASPAEAEENALAGYGDLSLPDQRIDEVKSKVSLFDNTICSRCGLCDSSCSQKLPISWLFRAGYISLYPSETFETQDEFEYFNLHPDRQAACSMCPDVTCHCPHEIDIPAGLSRIHQSMNELMDQGLCPPPRPLQQRIQNGKGYGARIIIRDIPTSIRPGDLSTCRLYLENIGQRPWYTKDATGQRRTVLFVYLDGDLKQIASPRFDVHPGERGHFVFEFSAPLLPGPYMVRLDLAETHSTNTILQAINLLQVKIVVSND
jgi:predicted aldo/keto reductase-like oxidoreductase